MSLESSQSMAFSSLIPFADRKSITFTYRLVFYTHKSFDMKWYVNFTSTKISKTFGNLFANTMMSEKNVSAFEAKTKKKTNTDTDSYLFDIEIYIACKTISVSSIRNFFVLFFFRLPHIYLLLLLEVCVRDMGVWA